MRAAPIVILALVGGRAVAQPSVPPPTAPPADGSAAPGVTPAVAPVAPVADPGLGEASTNPDTLQIHGWVSQGFMMSAYNNYFSPSSRSGSFQFFETGLNVTKELTSKLRAGIQIFAQDLGPIGNYVPGIDWAYVDYRVNDKLDIHVGRFKMPLYLYTERMDADMSRTSVLMPQAVYDAQYRDVLNAISGVGISGRLGHGKAGSLDYDAYGGAVYIQPRGAVYSVKNVVGARLIYNTPSCLRAAAHIAYTNFTATTQLSEPNREGVVATSAQPASWDGSVVESFDNWVMYGGALECSTEHWTAVAETGIWQAHTTYAPAINPAGELKQLRGYAMVENHISDRWSAAAYFSVFQSDVLAWSSAPADHQYDVAVSGRFDITPNWLMKLELHGFDGYGLADETGIDIGEGKKRWGMVLAKTTVSF